MVHGIGSACDIKFRSITEVVDGFRNLTSDLSERHFQSAHLSGKANRVEFLPVNWHTTLHGEDTGTDERLKPLTLKSIPKLRSFVNDTLLDILFYTSPVYCQKILNTVVSEINRMYTLFMVRNEGFKGQVSLMGHSLGSLIVFDILSHQSEGPFRLQEPDGPRNEDLNLEQVFAKLGISDYLENFTAIGLDNLDSVKLLTPEDLRKEMGLPQDISDKLRNFLDALPTPKGHRGDGIARGGKH